MEYEDEVSDVDEVVSGNMNNLPDSDVFDIEDDGIAEYKNNDNYILYPSLIPNSEQFIFTVFVYKKLGFASIGHDYSRSF